MLHVEILPSILEFSAGDIVHALIGFSNDAKSELIITGIEASFRYVDSEMVVLLCKVMYIQVPPRLQLLHSKRKCI